MVDEEPLCGCGQPLSRYLFMLLFICLFDVGATAYNKKRNCCIEKIK